MTFADSVLHLVRAGARIEPNQDRATDGATGVHSSLPAEVPVVDGARPHASDTGSRMVEDAIREGFEFDVEAPDYEPGLADLEAAVALVSEGLATRITLSGFPSWPGLLWRAYQLAAGTDVLILPTVVRPGGKVDIVVTRDSAPHG